MGIEKNDVCEKCIFLKLFLLVQAKKKPQPKVKKKLKHSSVHGVRIGVLYLYGIVGVLGVFSWC